MRRTAGGLPLHHPEVGSRRPLGSVGPGEAVSTLGGVEGRQRLWYARRPSTQDEPVRGEDATDLADSIVRAERLSAGQGAGQGKLPG